MWILTEVYAAIEVSAKISWDFNHLGKPIEYSFPLLDPDLT